MSATPSALPFRLAALTLWLSLLAVAVFASPPPAPDTGDTVLRMVTGRFEGLNLSLVALFNLMGVWPLLLARALRFDASGWKWPFLAGSFALGAFALGPWLVLRPWGAPRVQPGSRVGRLLGSRVLGWGLGLAFAGLVGLFLLGDVRTFAALARTQQFPFVMSFDFLACCLAAGLLALERPGPAP